MSVGKAPACVPTWRGHIETTKDALMIFEACFNGTLAHCFRRPHDRERNQLIVSGNVFVYEEATSGIKRSTDGIPWSPSRILTNFLIYRQLNSPFPPGEKKRATKRSQRALRPGDHYPTSASSTPTTDEGRPFPGPASPNPSQSKPDDGHEKDIDRCLIGSLVDSYEFKDDGLLKKTMTVTVHNVQHHLVSYYSLGDAKHSLRTPRDDPRLKDLTIREPLLNQPKFKFPNLDDAGDGSYEQMEGPQNAYSQYYPQNGYDPRIYPPNSALQAPQVSSPMAFHPAYAPSHPPSTGPGYASIAPSTSNYASIPLGPAPYPQHQPHAQYPPHFKQEGVPPYQGQAPQHPQQYQPHHYGNHPQDQHVQHPNYQQQTGGHALPRPQAMVDYLQGSSAESSMSHDLYGSPSIKAEGLVPTSHPHQGQSWTPAYSQQWGTRPDGQPYSSSYRSQS